MRMQYFADSGEVERLERLLREAPGDAREDPRLALAWYLRQTDSARALTLADDLLRARLGHSPPGAGAAIAGRAALVRAEAAIHQTRLDDARLELEAAEAHFGDDRIGHGDAALCAALLANARGKAGDALRFADDAARRFAEADPAARGDREDVARAYAALTSVYADPPSLPSRLEALQARWAQLAPVAAVLAGVTRSLQHFNRGEHLEVVKALEPLAQQALRLGMLQLRLRIGNTIAAAYSNLDDKEAAISWVEESLDLARAAAWPVATGEALAFLGNFYREVGQIDRALETLEQARSTLRLAARSRGYALACCYYAHAQLAAGAPALALALADEAVDVANAINAIPIVVDMLTVSARARARLGEPLPACELAMRALELAKSQELAVWQVDVLRALAEIHGEHRLQPPEGVAPGHASLHFLSQAQMVVDSLSGHAEGVAIARELARAYETAGDLRTALQAERAAFAQALSEDARRINNRLLAIEARHQVEKQRMEVLHQRQIAAAEAARAEALARTNSELRAAQAELERLANTDVLTGIANRRHFLANARAECERALRYGRSLAFVMGDIDRFKAINDAWGHPCGDLVITTAARVLDSRRRSVDSIGRLGGEEFGLLLPEADLATALGVAERVREAIETAAIEWEGRPIAFTMSFGLAVVEPAAGERVVSPAEVLEALISRADGALYAAKAAGRNCVRDDKW